METLINISLKKVFSANAEAPYIVKKKYTGKKRNQ